MTLGKGDGGWRDTITNQNCYHGIHTYSIDTIMNIHTTLSKTTLSKTMQQTLNYTQQTELYSANRNYCQHEYAYAPVKSMNNVTYNIPRQADDNHQ